MSVRSNDDVMRIISPFEARNLWRRNLQSSVEDVNNALSEIQEQIMYEAERGRSYVVLRDYKSIVPTRQVRVYVELLFKDMGYSVSRDGDELEIEWSEQ